jgi:hypothetical protein
MWRTGLTDWCLAWVLVKVGGYVSRSEPQLLAQPQARHLPAFYRVIKPALAHLPQPAEIVSIQQPHIRCHQNQGLVPLPGTSRGRDQRSGPWRGAQPAQVPQQRDQSERPVEPSVQPDLISHICSRSPSSRSCGQVPAPKPGSKNRHPATRHDVGKTIKRTEPKKKTPKPAGRQVK